MTTRSKLIEHVAKRVCDSLMKKIPRIQHAQVKVSKLHPPIKGDVDRVSVVYKTSR